MPRTRNNPPRPDSSLDRIMERQQTNEKSFQVSNDPIQQQTNAPTHQVSNEPMGKGSVSRTYAISFETIDQLENIVQVLRRQYPNHYVTREAVVQKAIGVLFTMWQGTNEPIFNAADFIAKKEKQPKRTELREDF